MIDNLIQSPEYWAVFSLSMLLFFVFFKYFIFDYKFYISLIISQYLGCLFYLSDEFFSSLIFSILFALVMICSRKYVLRMQRLPRPEEARLREVTYEAYYIGLSKAFVLLYFTLRFISYPIYTSELDMASRLNATHDNKLIYIMSLAAIVPVSALIYHWSVTRRMRAFDIGLAALIFVGFLLSGSKQSIVPLFFAVVGMASYIGRPPKMRYIGLGLGIILLVGGGMLKIFFPTLTASDISELILYRVVANTDNFEYLQAINQQPGQYPYAGIAALCAPLANRLGANIDYSIGVWLFGERYGVWDGFGPNSGFVIEFFGNLGYAGLFVALGFGAAIGYVERRVNLFRAVLLSILPTILFENLIFIEVLLAHLTFSGIARLCASASTYRRHYGRRIRPPNRSQEVM